MNRSRLLLSLAVVLTLAALTAYEHRLITRREIQSAALETSLRQTQEQLSVLTETRVRNLHDLSAARHQLDELTSLIKPALAATESEREIEMRAWLVRAKELRALFEQNPGQQIPELSLLTEADWLRASRRINLSDEESRRMALAKVRAIAKEKFTRDLASALTKFTSAHAGKFPAEILELTPYFSSPVDSQMLQRYALTNPSESARKFTPAIQEKNAVDPDYDRRPVIFANGAFGSSPAPEAWIENFLELNANASEAYRKANNGAISLRLADLIPYMNPPLPPATAEKLLAAERKRTR